MIPYRILERPAFDVVGKKTWISGPDNDLFGKFWVAARAEGLLQRFHEINGQQPGPQTQGTLLGISRVEEDPNKRDFYY